MDIFISWSGSASQSLAQALRGWLRAVVQLATPWMSEVDIHAGQRWGHEVANRLEGTKFGIVCVTPENLASPWLMFEAGALARSVSSARLVPVLLGIRKANLTLPLAQFQAVETDVKGIKSLVVAINEALGDRQLPAETIAITFEALWPQLEHDIKAIPPAVSEHERAVRSERDLLEELVVLVRQLGRPKLDRVDLPVIINALRELHEQTESHRRHLDDVEKSFEARGQPSPESLDLNIENTDEKLRTLRRALSVLGGGT
ncbi:MAG: toll/interleukin-1 receptor domain-containing protein [Deltaproteobacteria bacterium]|nr:toll/interleukin-1 receptor domain-containing protein [Deltaproteobacteria bacterium]